MSKIFRPLFGFVGLTILIWSTVIGILAGIAMVISPLFLMDPSGIGVIFAGIFGIGGLIVLIITGTTWWVGLIWWIVELVRKNNDEKITPTY